MAKQVTLTNSKLAANIANAMVAVDTSGVCETICADLQSRFAGAAVPKDDAAAISAEVARLRGWTPKSAAKRIIELGNFYHSYSLLPMALEKLRATKSNDKQMSYSSGVALARMLKNGKTVTQAVAAYVTGSKGNKVAPADRDLEASMESASTHVKRILEHTKLPTKFRSALAALCVDHGITL